MRDGGERAPGYRLDSFEPVAAIMVKLEVQDSPILALRYSIGKPGSAYAAHVRLARWHPAGGISLANSDNPDCSRMQEPPIVAGRDGLIILIMFYSARNAVTTGLDKIGCFDLMPPAAPPTDIPSILKPSADFLRPLIYPRFHMDNLAQNYQPSESASLAGLEEVFEVREQDANQALSSPSVREQDASYLSVEQAAALLGISVRAVQKRLKKGALTGHKEKTDRGERWLVAVREQDASRLENGSSVREQDASQSENGSFAQTDHPAQTAQDVIMIEAGVGGEHAPGTEQLTRELLAKLEVLTYRNGYLEAQLAERQKEVELHQQQIKLLTDSQHSRGWWSKFASWFMGGG